MVCVGLSQINYSMCVFDSVARLCVFNGFLDNNGALRHKGRRYIRLWYTDNAVKRLHSLLLGLFMRTCRVYQILSILFQSHSSWCYVLYLNVLYQVSPQMEHSVPAWPTTTIQHIHQHPASVKSMCVYVCVHLFLPVIVCVCLLPQLPHRIQKVL